MSNRKKICYLVSHGFAARMVLQSGLLASLLEQNFDVELLVPLEAKASLTKFERGGVRIHGVAYKKRQIHSTIGDARRYLRESLRDNAALWSRHLYLANGCAGKTAQKIAKINYVLHRIFGKSRLLRWLFDQLDTWIHRAKDIRSCLRELCPDLVVSTYPVTAFEISGLIEARSLNIRTVGHLLSWDNITCKGRFVVVPDRFITWGPVMSRELEEVYGSIAIVYSKQVYRILMPIGL